MIYEFFAHYVAVPLATPVLLAIGGLMVGGVAVWMVAPSRKQLRALETELEHTRSEHRVYRVKVTDHFQETSDLVANMTASYKAVYDHLACGAQDLCEGRPALEDGKFGVPVLIADRSVDVGTVAGNGSDQAGDNAAVAGENKPSSWTMSEPTAAPSPDEEHALETARETAETTSEPSASSRVQAP